MLAVIVGLLFMVSGILGVIFWWSSFLVVVKGLIPAMIICGGVLSVIAGTASIRDSMNPGPLQKGPENKEE